MMIAVGGACAGLALGAITVATMDSMPEMKVSRRAMADKPVAAALPKTYPESLELPRAPLAPGDARERGISDSGARPYDLDQTLTGVPPNAAAEIVEPATPELYYPEYPVIAAEPPAEER